MAATDQHPSLTTEWCVRFAEGDPEDVSLLGGKGAGLARMSRAGLSVPPGFVITTRVCAHYVATGEVPAGLMEEVRGHVGALEQEAGRTFGGGPLPLLVSVRSGAPVSMPGMMDTILDLGISRDAAVALADATDDPAFVLDVTRRFQKCFAEIVFAANPEVVDESVADFELDGDREGFGDTWDRYWTLGADAVLDDVDETIPNDPWEQLQAAVVAVLDSWNSRRAVAYRDHHKISHEMGTAVVVQSMVFGNLGSPSGTGVAFTRSPVTGEPRLYGEFLESGQGEDVVAGTSDPETIDKASERHPEVFDELKRICAKLELSYGDALDIEYTVEQGKLYMLQVRSAKRTPDAAIKIATDLLREGRMEPSEAVASLSADHVRWVDRPTFEKESFEQARADGAVLATGVGASPGQVSGKLVLDADRAVEQTAGGVNVVLARPTTSPLDLHGMIGAVGIVTARGGATSHAAVVARALAKPCIVGCSDISIDEEQRTLAFENRVLKEGDDVSIDGESGELLVGSLSMTRAGASSDDLSLLMQRVDTASECRVVARVTTPEQAKSALERGATGVVTSVDDVLATSGQLVDVLEGILRGDNRASAVSSMQDAVCEAFAPLLAALGEVEIDVRAIDVRGEETRELLPRALLDDAPRLSLPVGDPDLLRAQMTGLALAAERSGYAPTLRLAVRHVTDPREARAIRELAEEVLDGRPIAVGTYVSSPRALMDAAKLAEVSEVLWVEVRALQSAMFGIPPSQLLTANPLDDYLRRGMLSVDPRSDIDSTTYELLERVAGILETHPKCRIGMRLSGPVSEDIAARLYALGFRLFAVGSDELRVARLALGKAAWA